ncbi:hypothetical protein DLB48_10510 [Salmonella enterica subsp. enterica]|nr:hypothetical protein [Salmonella enterica subsp. enterica serovar Mikawasima]EBR9838988.1 hypothetical protein [Salmonella enterica subsp. enterica serovar Mikawasima]EBS4933326.1 hypothetical protein [Salmonella enterica subsp. enterica serovar Mikawasima]EBU8891056.1 hypothetical protein [Salmonella enterica subsp. enterica serovar Mikawasima]EBW2082165.1 hypothetical protein [Salmonella enterica subsp. enterica serovar Mikawasima]
MLKATGGEPVALVTFPGCLRQAGQNQLNKGDKCLKSDDSDLKKSLHPFAPLQERGTTVKALTLPG